MRVNIGRRKKIRVDRSFIYIYLSRRSAGPAQVQLEELQV